MLFSIFLLKIKDENETKCVYIYDEEKSWHKIKESLKCLPRVLLQVWKPKKDKESMDMMVNPKLHMTNIHTLIVHYIHTYIYTTVNVAFIY